MNISLIQTDVVWAGKSMNLDKTEIALKNLCGKTDLVVLPEMFSTGFCTDRLDLAESTEGETISKLRSWSQEYKLAVTGSFIAAQHQKIFNRAFFVFPTGEVHTADKRHLFSIGGEHKHFSAGNERMIVNYRGFNICVLVCYDIRFPVWSRNRANEYDLLIYTANFPHSRINVWDTLLKARAIENQTYLCGVNRVGEDGEGLKYPGHSVMLDYMGNEILGFPEYSEETGTVTISRAKLDTFRNRYPFWKDSDSFDISL